MTDFARSTICFHPPTWVDFWLFIGVEVQLMLFVKRFLFFPPGAADLNCPLKSGQTKVASVV